MALSRQDLKKIHLGVAAELKRVLSAANGDRMLAKRKPAVPMQHPDDPDTEAMLSEMAGGEPESPAEDDGEVYEKAIPRLRKNKGFPPKK